MSKLHLGQAAGTEKRLKAVGYRVLTDANKTAQKTDLFNGHHHVYHPLNEEGEKIPPDQKRIEQTVADLLQQVRDALIGPYDLSATVAQGNMLATADLEVDGHLLLSKMPVQFYLFIEKQIADVKTFIDNLPVLDAGEQWEFDANAGYSRNKPCDAIRTKKVQRPLVLKEATKEHPAQTQLVTDDVQVGTWVKTRFSSALPLKTKRELQRRVNQLQIAVIAAREEANTLEVEKQRVGAKIFDYLFAPVLGTKTAGPDGQPL